MRPLEAAETFHDYRGRAGLKGEWMVLSQAEFGVLLQRLKEQQTESSTVDGKADLRLETEGDKAYFIRHAAALANNVEPSYLIVGVEDRTWTAIGLSADSALRSPDQTEQRLNQILASRLDPNLSVRYCTHELDGVLYGLVAVEGTRAPYIVAVEDQEYGGQRTQGKPSYIQRGAIYVRRGSSSIAANRQSDVLGVVGKAQRVMEASQPDSLLIEHNYLDIQSKEFAHYALPNSLIEVRHSETASGREYVKAESWVSFLFYPGNGNCRINTVELKSKLTPDKRIGRAPEWYRSVPRPFIEMLYSPRATPREFTATWYEPRQDRQHLTHFVSIQPSGHIEIGCTHPLFLQYDGTRCFHFVNLVGYLWQMTCLAQAIYRDVGFHGEVACLTNLVGTTSTVLIGFAESKQGGWASPFSPWYTLTEQDVCQDTNIQSKKTIWLAEAADAEVEDLVRDAARDIGAYYGQDRPRCFDYHTSEFPVRQYLAETRW